MPATGTTRRQRHSPRVRRLGGDHGVELDRLTGTGPLGRVVPGDVLRAAQVRAPHHDSPRARRASVEQVVAPPVVDPGRAPVSAPTRRETVAHESVVLEVDATGEQPADLVVRAVAAAVGAVHRLPGMTGSAGTTGSAGPGPRRVDVALSRHDEDGSSLTHVPAADGLNADALRAAATSTAMTEPGHPASTGPEPSSATVVAVHDLTALGVRSAAIAPVAGELVSLTIGAPTTRVVAVEADGGTGVALRVVAELTLSWDQGVLATSAALALVRDVSRGLGRDVVGSTR